jgi:uroporphyrinogen decarboxylase
MSSMTHRERLQATLAGKSVDRPAVAFWRHWPIDDQDAEMLARAQFDYQRKYDWDFIKVTPSHTYCIDDYGAQHVYRGIPIGDRDHVKRVIARIEDWDRIQPLDVTRGAYARQLRCLELVLQGRDANTPVIQTVFNPLAMAKFLADEDYLVHLRQDPKRVERALAALTDTCLAFVKAAIAAGADGIFLSTSAASYEAMSEDEYRRFGRPGDLKVLEAARGGWLNLLHLHGQHPMFSSVVDYPVQGLNWHDRAAGPSLADAAPRFPRALVGGVEQYTLLHFGTPAEVKAQVRDAIAQTNGRRLIVAAGCTYPLTVPDGNLLAARQAVEEH